MAKSKRDQDSAPRLNARGEPFQPGDLILDRYMADASVEEREEARENLRKLAMVYVDIIKRHVADGTSEKVFD